MENDGINYEDSPQQVVDGNFEFVVNKIGRNSEIEAI